ncbi:MAG: transglycosylase family protein [Thermoleophilaceae bacterium]|jgi:hypothetical protein|nr:transglycosylase family protein [Thermoleophilaceae bacterium]
MLNTRNQIVAAGALGLLAAASAGALAADPAKAGPAPSLDAAGPLAQEPFEALNAQRLRPVADVPSSRAGRAEQRLERSYRALYRRAKRRELSPGRDIAADGVRDGRRARPATPRELRTSIVDLRQMLRDGHSSSTAGASGGSSSSTAGAGLESIAACESGGDPSAVGGGGQYRGKYQFDQQTWQSVGGNGDPASASEAEQDQRAAALVAQQGKSAWPNCGG